jgi:hypothetical protein
MAGPVTRVALLTIGSSGPPTRPISAGRPNFVSSTSPPDVAISATPTTRSSNISG